MSNCKPKRCPTPSNPRRKLGTLWSCPDCGQVLVLREINNYPYRGRVWKPTLLRTEVEA